MFKNRLKTLFIPCSENSFRPDFLERMSATMMLMLVILSFAIANLQALVWIGSDWMVSTILPATIVNLTNSERSNEHLGMLVRNAKLDRAAKLKAQDMAENSYFAHYSPSGISPWYWFDKVHYVYAHAGENLAVHFTDSHDVVDAWMNSPLHKANMMDGTYTEIGVGTARGEFGGVPTVFVVQLFGTEQESSVVTQKPIVEKQLVLSNDISLETVTHNDIDLNNQVLETVSPASIQTVSAEQTKSTIQEEVVNGTENKVSVVPQNRDTDTATVQDTAIYSNLATTSRTVESAPIGFVQAGSTIVDGFGFVGGVTQPGTWLQYVYFVLAGIVVVSLILSVVIEWRKQHPLQIVYAGGLLAGMALLLYVHVALTGGATIV